MPGGFNDVTGDTNFAFHDSVTTRTVSVVGSPQITLRLTIAADPQPFGDVRMRVVDVEDPSKVLPVLTVAADGVTRQFSWKVPPGSYQIELTCTETLPAGTLKVGTYSLATDAPRVEFEPASPDVESQGEPKSKFPEVAEAVEPPESEHPDPPKVKDPPELAEVIESTESTESTDPPPTQPTTEPPTEPGSGPAPERGSERGEIEIGKVLTEIIEADEDS